MSVLTLVYSGIFDYSGGQDGVFGNSLPLDSLVGSPYTLTFTYDLSTAPITRNDENGILYTGGLRYSSSTSAFGRAEFSMGGDPLVVIGKQEGTFSISNQDITVDGNLIQRPEIAGSYTQENVIFETQSVGSVEFMRVFSGRYLQGEGVGIIPGRFTQDVSVVIEYEHDTDEGDNENVVFVYAEDSSGVVDVYIATDDLFSADSDTVVFENLSRYSFLGGFNNGLAGNDFVNLPRVAGGIVEWGLEDGFYGGEGNDTVTGGYSRVTVYGDAGDDVITGSTEGDRLFGGDGVDTLNTTFGTEDDRAPDELTGGAGSDQFVIGNGDTVLDLEEGELVVVFGTNATISERSADGSYEVRTRIDGGQGGIASTTVRLVSATPLDFAKSEAAGLTYLTATTPGFFDEEANVRNFNDLDPANYTGSFSNALGGNDEVTLPRYDYLLRAWGLEQTFSGGTGNDLIVLGDSSPLFVSGGPNDSNGLDDKDTIFGGFGQDSIFGGAGADVLYGYFGDDGVSDTLSGGRSDSDVFHVGHRDYIADLEATETIYFETPVDFAGYAIILPPGLELPLPGVTTYRYTIQLYEKREGAVALAKSVMIDSADRLSFSASQVGINMRFVAENYKLPPSLQPSQLPGTSEQDSRIDVIFKSFFQAVVKADDFAGVVREYGKDLVELDTSDQHIFMNKLARGLSFYDRGASYNDAVKAIIEAGPNGAREFVAQAIYLASEQAVLRASLTASVRVGIAFGSIFGFVGAATGLVIGLVAGSLFAEKVAKPAILGAVYEIYDTVVGIQKVIFTSVVNSPDDAGVFHGTDGDDILQGSSVNDGFASSDGINTYSGGDGARDGVDYSLAPGPVAADLSAGVGGYGGSPGKLAAAAGAAVLTLTAHDTYFAIEDLIGSAFGDRLAGDAQANILAGGAGNDTLTGNGGDDSLVGAMGDDIYTVSGQAEIVFENANEGIDRVIASDSYYLWADIEDLTLTDIPGNQDVFGVGNELFNVITGNSGANLLIGLDGNDTISGGGGGDALFGVSGDDVLNGDAGIDYLAAGDGVDILDGGADADALYGEDGDDSLIGGASFDTDILIGGAGRDTLDGASNLGDYDLMDGGDGNDLYFVDTPADLTFEANGGGTDRVVADIVGAGYYLYPHVENLLLRGVTPFGVGNDLANFLGAEDGTQWLLGGAGDDSLDGGAGNDVLFGEIGADVFVFVGASGADVIGDFTPGTDRIRLIGMVVLDYAQLRNGFVENGGTTAIDLGDGNFIVLNGVANAALSAADFIFG